MKVDDTLIQTAIERILNVVSPERIILFGSAAAGQITLESDIDLLVIEKSFTGRREESVWLRKAIADLGVPVDVFAMTPERFEETKDIIGGLAYPANKYGKVVYEAA